MENNSLQKKRIMNIETYRTKLRKLSPAIQSVLGIKCSVTTDAVVDDADQLREAKARAISLNIATSLRSIYDNSETVSGRLGRVLMYYFINPLTKKPDALDRGPEYEVGSELKFGINSVNHYTITPNMFREFIEWIVKDYPEFVEGLKDNPSIPAELKAVI